MWDFRGRLTSAKQDEFLPIRLVGEHMYFMVKMVARLKPSLLMMSILVGGLKG